VVGSEAGWEPPEEILGDLRDMVYDHESATVSFDEAGANQAGEISG
jgi:hypothetical protein